jgi:hypothetical protein
MSAVIRSSSVAPLAIQRRLNVPTLFQGPADFDLRELLLLRPIIGHIFRLPVFRDELCGLFPVGFPIEVRDLRFRAQEIFRMPMTFEAPRHAVGFVLVHYRHPIHLPVTAGATDPTIHMRGVIVKNVIRRAMNLHPLDGLPAFPARPDRFEFRIIFLHLRMTIHAGLGVRQIRMRRDIDKTVAIPAIHPELGHVNIVRKWHRLDRLITDARVLRGHIVPSRAGQAADDYRAADRDFERQPVRPAWKKIRHKTLANCACAKGQPPF